MSSKLKQRGEMPMINHIARPMTSLRTESYQYVTKVPVRWKSSSRPLAFSIFHPKMACWFVVVALETCKLFFIASLCGVDYRRTGELQLNDYNLLSLHCPETSIISTKRRLLRKMCSELHSFQYLTGCVQVKKCFVQLFPSQAQIHITQACKLIVIQCSIG